MPSPWSDSQKLQRGSSARGALSNGTPDQRRRILLGGYRNVEIVDTTAPPKLELSVGFSEALLQETATEEETNEEVPELDWTGDDEEDLDLEFDLDDDAPDGSILGSLYKDGQSKGRPSHLPMLAPKLLKLIEEHQTTIVFVNSRGATERLTQTINELADREVALAHHGSMSTERRELVEEALKTGSIEAIIATSSLELGVDMGSVDLVIQLESPGAVSRGLQRVGRAATESARPAVESSFPNSKPI